MDRKTLGLAVGAGYALGRTKKMKLALVLGAMAAGRRLPVSPAALKGVVADQMKNNPQLKGVGDKLRGDLRGVGQAAAGALVERRIEGLADRLQSRTSGVRERMAGGEAEPEEPEGEAPDTGEGEAEPEEPEGEAPDTGEGEAEPEEEPPSEEAGEPRPPRKKAPARKAAKKAPAGKAPARKVPDKRAAGHTRGRVPPAKKAAPARTERRSAARGEGRR